MRRIVLAATLLSGLAFSASADTVIFVDGTRMQVKSYQVKGAMVVLTTTDGKLRSVPAAYVNLDATERANRRAGRASEPPPPAPARPAAPATTTAPPSPAPAPPPAPEVRSSAPAPPPSSSVELVADLPNARPLPSDYPSDATATTWSNEELQVSLVVPSSAWHLRAGESSYDVAVHFDKPAAEARATLALIRRRMKNYAAFQKALVEVQASTAASPGYQPLQSKHVAVGPYTAYEIRFLKEADGRTSYNRLVSFYSKDMIYALSMSCPEERVADNDPDFEAFVLGLQIKKSRDEIVPKGAPES